VNVILALRPRSCPPGVDPRRWRQALAARIEWQLACVDRLIAALDAMDADPDCEPSLAAPEIHPSAGGAILPRRDGDGAQIAWSAGGLLDLEEDADADDHDDNPVTLNPERRSR
jgi:hypothetical protein